jgi:enterochelin esterase-like enzyme/dienelactone hydrolase
MPRKSLFGLLASLVLVSGALPFTGARFGEAPDTSRLVPLTDMTKEDKYRGFEGGLYPECKNQRPAEHDAAGLRLAKKVVPLDNDGKPSADGKIVVLGIGFSNTFQCFKGFQAVAAADRNVNPRVVLVNGAVGGIPAEVAQHEDGQRRMGQGGQARVVKYWEEVDKRLKQAGVTPKQVEVVWIKETNPAPHKESFPKYTRDLQAQITKIVQLLPKRFPNVQLVYLSSRSWGGWAKVPAGSKASQPGNSEPYSYETAFAVKWLIERQLKGEAELNFDPAKGAVKAPWLSWGPYWWANGENKRKDGFHFQKSDFRDNDQMHHSEAGMKKLGQELLRFFKTDTTTRTWFTKGVQDGGKPENKPRPGSDKTEAKDGEWESLADGSTGKTTTFTGKGGTVIPAYIRKPKGRGPFPVVVLLHGGRYGKAPTYGMGRSTRSPVGDFVKAGWAVYSIDYRPNEKISIEPIETEDTLEAVKAVRKLPFIDPGRVGMMGASHGANVASRVISRVDLQGAILCAPAAMDLIEVKKAAGRGEPVVPILKKLIADMEKQHGATAEEIDKAPKKYGYSSALTEAAEVRCPLLLINAHDDDNSPVSIIDLYVKKLRAADKRVETYLPKKGGHGFYFGRPDIEETKEAARLAVAFFQRQFQQEGSGKPDQKPDGKTTARYQYGVMNWVDPDRTEPPGTHYKTFASKTIKADVSYLVYLPPDYDKQPTTRYPVLYYLHASGGTPRRAAQGIVARLDKAIRAGRVDPLIIVFPNGLRGATMYCDSKDGQYPVESVLVKDLIPHVDAAYRTVAAREGRAVEGFSMGGFGAAHLGFKFPEVFGVVSIQAPPLLGPDLQSPLPKRAWSKLFPSGLGGDLDYFRANDPFTLVLKNAAALRDRTVIRIVTHVEDENWLAPRCEELHRLLMKHTIAHHFLYLSNVKSHSAGQVMDTLGDAGLMFFGSAFRHLRRISATKTPN